MPRHVSAHKKMLWLGAYDLNTKSTVTLLKCVLPAERFNEVASLVQLCRPRDSSLTLLLKSLCLTQLDWLALADLKLFRFFFY
jgi:hypothetical protein